MATQLTLARDGQTRYQVVVANRANVRHRHAAGELARFLGEITGAQFPVVAEKEWAGGPAIFVGMSASARRAAPQASVRGLGRDGLVILTAPPHLLLFGGEPRGTLYAVYTFLEDYLGCRWWAPGASTIPRRTTLRLGAISDRQVPIVEYREPFFAEAFDGDWAVRNKSNGASERLDEARGGKITYQGFVHTFYPLVPPDQYFGKHPEWYSEINGKRVASDAQLCLTNEELKRFVAERVKEWLRGNPKVNIVSVSQNDCGGYCQCAACQALDEKEGSHSGSLLHFVNYVAREVGREFPNVAIDTLAYQYTRKPPRFVRPEPNVIVRLCSIECNFARPLTDPSNKTFFQDLVGWSKVSRRLYVWDYVTDFAHYLKPHPNVFVLGPNVKTFVTHGVRGIFEQGSYTTPGGDMSLLKTWVLAKLLWNPERDPGALIREFLHGYFGPAGPHVGRYLRLLHADAVKGRYYLGCFAPLQHAFPSYQTMVKSEQAFAQARQAVAGNAELERRVRQVHMPLLYTWIFRPDLQALAEAEGFAWAPGGEYASGVDAFLAACREIGVQQHREGRPFSEIAEGLAGRRHKPAPPAGFEQTKGLMDLQDHLFSIREGTARVEDPQASDGMCVVMPGDKNDEWEAQADIWLGQGTLIKQPRYRCFAVVKCEFSGSQGLAFRIGLWNHDRREDKPVREVAISQVQPGWHAYELGTVDFREVPSGHLWVGMVGNGANVKSVAVDRFFLVPVK